MTLHIGFIGAGRMALCHVEHLINQPDVRISAACDQGSGRAQAFVAKYGGRAYSDYRQMLENEQLDAVYICTPTPSHCTIGLACATRNLHIFMEKPLDLDLRIAKKLIEEVERRKLLAMTAFHWRYSDGYKRAEEMVNGEPIALLHLQWYWTRPPIHWMWNAEVAGGQIVDQNIHLVDASAGFGGEITQVYAAYNRRQVNFEPDFINWDGYALTLHYASGAVGCCAGTYGLFKEIQERPRLDICLRDRMVRLTDEGVSLFTPSGVQEWKNEGEFHRGVNQAFLAALRQNDRSLIRTPLSLGLRSTAVTLAANQSAATGQVVDVEAFLAAH